MKTIDKMHTNGIIDFQLGKITCVLMLILTLEYSRYEYYHFSDQN